MSSFLTQNVSPCCLKSWCSASASRSLGSNVGRLRVSGFLQKWAGLSVDASEYLIRSLASPVAAALSGGRVAALWEGGDSVKVCFSETSVYGVRSAKRNRRSVRAVSWPLPILLSLQLWHNTQQRPGPDCKIPQQPIQQQAHTPPSPKSRT